MKRNTRLQNAVFAALASVCLAQPVLAQDRVGGTETHLDKNDINLLQKKEYSPYLDQSFPNRVLWGNTHVHTSFSFDSGLMGVTLGPEQMFRFVRGEEFVTANGVRVKIDRPLDWLAITDHAEYLGMADQIRTANPDLLATEYGRRWYNMFKTSKEEGFKAAYEVFLSIGEKKELVKGDKLKRSAWEHATAAAERFNQPGVFTALQGYEWTSAPGGNNLHRTVIFRDGAERVNRIIPFSAFDSEDPADLWKFMGGYERLTGGEVLAIPHNGNISNGHMYTVETYDKKPMDRAYAEERIRREPLMEVTQVKGNGETHPFLSPTDEFANYELWDFGNAANPPVPKEKSMLQWEYARSALKNGLKLEAQLGVNPYKFGMVGGSDQHVGVLTSQEDNFFGEFTNGLPSPDRWKSPIFKDKDGKPIVTVWQEQTAGLGAVWSRENTREAVWDALKRKEAYATTGTRIIVRVFAGWDFQADEVERPDFAAQGYRRGVPMGGDLNRAPEGKAPAFMVRSLRDPDGANLDRVQIIKGWLDAKGETLERIFDVAVSGGRKIGPDGRCATPVGNSVDVANATYTNTIGTPLMTAYWKDPEFDPKQRAFYYVRVIEIPTPRWTAYDQKRFGIKMADYVPMTVNKRAYTSPIWYTP